MTVPPPGPRSGWPAGTGRRRFLGLMSALPLLGQGGVLTPLAPASSAAHLPPGALPGGAAHAVPAVPFPHGAAAMLIGGPRQGRLHQWAARLAPALGEALPPGTAVGLTCIGGLDGVTAANQFGARARPDGQTLLVAPGNAALAWLAGDARARFDVGAWVTVLTAASPGVLIGRFGPGDLRAGRKLRMAVSGRDGVDLAGLLALELLGAWPRPMPAMSPAAVRAALAAGTLDAALLVGEKVAARTAALARLGLRPVATFGTVDATGRPLRDPAFPDLPQVAELFAEVHGRAPSGPLYEAWRGTAAAAQMVFGMQLPQLTSAAMVALWRQAGAHAVRQPGVAAAAARAGLRPLAGPEGLAAARQIAVGTPALLALRQWLDRRLPRQPA